MSAQNHIMSVRYAVKGASFVAEKPEQWSPATMGLTGNNPNYDVTPDGKRMVVLVRDAAETERKGSLHLTVLLNFFDELKRRMP